MHSFSRTFASPSSRSLTLEHSLARTLSRTLTLTVALMALGTSACSGCATVAARPCSDDSDCEAGELCVVNVDGGTCAKPGEGEGEGEGGEGEGEEGEGEGEGEDCGNGVVEDGEGCDDGNDDELDACTSACALTLARLEAVAGATPPGELAVGLSSAVAVSGDRLILADEARVMAAGFDAAGEVSSPWLRVSGGASSRDVSSPEDSFASVPINIASDAAGNLYWVPGSRDRVLVKRPGASSPQVVLGGGDVDAYRNPPGFTFTEAGTELGLDEVNAVDVAPDGTVFVAANEDDDGPTGRVLRLAVDGTVSVIVGSYVFESTGGTPAQNANIFNDVADIAVESDAQGHPTGLWLAIVNERPRHVTLADGAITTLAGTGDACDDGPLAGCALVLALVDDDGAGGFYGFDVGHRGIFHVDAALQVTRVAGDTTLPFEGSAGAAAADAREAFVFPADLAFTPGHIFFTDRFAQALYRIDVEQTPAPLVVVVNAIEPAPERASDRNLGFYSAVALSDDHVFVATTNAIWRVALADGATSIVLTQEDAGPCSSLSFDRGLAENIAVTNAGDVVYFSQVGGAALDRVCRHVVGGSTDVFLDAADGLTNPRSLDVLDDDSELWVLDDAGLMRFTQSSGTALGEVVADGNLVFDFDARSLCNYTYATSTGMRARVCSGGAESDVAGAPSGGSAIVGMTETESSLAISGTGILFDVSSGVELAGSGVGFADGGVIDARFESEIRDIDVGDDFLVAVLSPTSVRIVLNPNGIVDVTTLVGSDARTDDGRLREARLFSPLSFSCSATSCIAAEDELGTFRMVDLASGRIDRVYGGDGASAEPAVSFTAIIDDDTFVWPDGGVASFTIGAFAPTVERSPAAFYEDVSAIRVVDVDGGEPVILTARTTGDLSLIGGAVVREGTTSQTLVSLAATARPASGVWRAWALDLIGSVIALDLNAADLAPVERTFLEASSLALDANDNLVVASSLGIVQFDVNDDVIEESPRVLVPIGDPLLPIECDMLLDRAGDDVLAADTCNGAILRLVVSAP